MNSNKEHNHVLIKSGSIKNAGEIFNGCQRAYESISANFLVSDIFQLKVLRARDAYHPQQISILDFATGSCTNYQAPIESTEQNPISAIDFLGSDSLVAEHNGIIYILSYSDIPGEGTLKKLLEFSYNMKKDDKFFAIKQTNDFFAVITQNGYISVYPKKEGSIEIAKPKLYHCYGEIFSSSVDPSTNLLCIGLSAGQITLLDLVSGKNRTFQVFPNSDLSVNSISCMNGNVLAGALCSCSSRIPSWEQIPTNVKEHQCANKYVIFSPKKHCIDNETPILPHFSPVDIPKKYYPQELLLTGDKFLLRAYCLLENKEYEAIENVLLVHPTAKIDDSQVLYNEKRSNGEIYFSKKNPLRMRITADNDHVIIFREQNFLCSNIGLSSKYQIFIPSDQLTYNQKVTLFLQKHPNIASFLGFAEITLFLTIITAPIVTLLFLLLKNRFKVS